MFETLQPMRVSLTIRDVAFVPARWLKRTYWNINNVTHDAISETSMSLAMPRMASLLKPL